MPLGAGATFLLGGIIASEGDAMKPVADQATKFYPT
jgi:hypothetical protein